MASAVEDLEFRVLKILYGAGSHGVLQKHLFERLPPSMTAKRLNAVAALQAGGFAEKATSRRATSRWGYLWTITNAGKREYVKRLADRSKLTAPVIPGVPGIPSTPAMA